MNLLAKAAEFRTQLIIGGIALTAVAVAFAATYNIAYNKGLNVSEVEIAEYQGKVEKLSNRLKEAQGRVTTRIQTQYLDRVVERERIVYRNRDVVVTQVPEQYILSQGWVDAHDASVRNTVLEPEVAANAFPSGYTDRDVLEVITRNYGQVCLANADQLTALQSWVTEQRKVNEEAIANR
jgi:hypothetical protein